MKYYKILINDHGVKKWVAYGSMGMGYINPKGERHAVIISDYCFNNSKTLKMNLEGKEYTLISVDNPQNAVGRYMRDDFFLSECP